MTTPPQVPLVDQGNMLLSHVPAQLHTGSLDMPDGKVGVVTIRTSSTTLTVFASAADLRTWADLLGKLSDQLSGGLLRVTPVDLAALSKQMELDKKNKG